MNPVLDWKILEFARTIFPLVQQHIAHENDFMVKAQSFGFMAQQKSEAMNFQHGDPYLSPSLATAVRYAVDKRFGSELLSYTLDFLEELLRRKVPGVADDLYRQYPHIFNLLDVSSARYLSRCRRWLLQPSQ